MIRKSSPFCPSCGSSTPSLIGPIPGSNAFAGRHLDRILPGGSLWKCSNCYLHFRSPILAKDDADELYRQGSSQSWAEPLSQRVDWQIVKKVISATPDIKSIIDVGCYDGRLLDQFGSEYIKLGIEVHQDAANIAKDKGIHIVGNDFESIPTLSSKLDAAVAIDVLEHVKNPLGFLEQVSSLVRADGLIIISTGNSHSWHWKLMGSFYWYCHVAEHISFINPPWVKYSASLLSLSVLKILFFSHAEGGFRKFVSQFLANFTYRLSPYLFSRLRFLGLGGLDVQSLPGLSLTPPYWLSAKDHMLIVYRKK